MDEAPESMTSTQIDAALGTFTTVLAVVCLALAAYVTLLALIDNLRPRRTACSGRQRSASRQVGLEP